MTIALGVLVLAGLVVGFWLLDRRAEARAKAYFVAVKNMQQAYYESVERTGIPLIEQAARMGAVAIAAELGERMGTMSRDNGEMRRDLRTIAGRLAGIETSVALIPGAIDAFRKLIDESFKEFEEKQIPPEGKEIGATAMSRIRNVREDIRAKEEASLKELQDSLGKAGFREPLIRVRSGD